MDILWSYQQGARPSQEPEGDIMTTIWAELAIVDGDRILTLIDRGDDYVDTVIEIAAPDADNADDLTAADEQLLASAGYAITDGVRLHTDNGVAYEVRAR